jgi:hypothetical protein
MQRSWKEIGMGDRGFVRGTDAWLIVGTLIGMVGTLIVAP